MSDKAEDIPNLEKDLNCSYPAEPMEGLFLKIVKGQLEKTEKNPNDYLWHSFWFLVRKSDRVVAGSADFKDIPNSKRILQRCGFVERLKIIYILRRFCMSNSVIFSPGTFFHGTRADLSVGDLLVPGYLSNYDENRAANYVYFTGTLDAAIWGAELASGDGKQRIFVVEPTGEFEDDPNVTDKKFPGNPTKSYRTTQPSKIVAEAMGWKGHSPEVLQGMRDHLKQLDEMGIKAVE